MKKVVVIGGGFAGSQIAKKLQKKFEVTLIDAKEYFEFTPGILRTLVEPEHAKKVQILHKDYLRNCRIILGKVKSIKDNFVFVNGEKIFFDYLAICAGSGYNAPFKEGVVIATRAKTLQDHSASLERAKNVLIIGGGLVGVELAGEICWKYRSGKKVTIVHAKERLIERNHFKAINYAENYLRKKGVEIICGERIIKTKGRKFFSDSGRKVEADLAFLCTGITPNFEFMKKNFSDSLNEKNQIKVNEFLQLKGKKNIFAAGDVNDKNEEKTAQNAVRQASVAARNILALEKNRGLRRYHSKKTPLVISLGKYRGILSANWSTFGGFTPAFMKWAVERNEMWKKRL